MLKDSRNLLWIIPLAGLLTMPLWKPLVSDFLSPVRKAAGPDTPSFTSPRILSSSEMEGVQFEQSRNGSREWFITAGRLYTAEDDPDMQLDDVKASFFGASREKEEIRIRSRKARYHADNNNITLQGQVVIKNDKGYEMRTESLQYLAAEKKIRTTAPVNIQGSNIEVSGNRLLYDIVSGNYSLSGNVVCRVW